MPKIDFSALKTADLRSVAPVDESARPSAHVSETVAASADPVPATAAAPVVPAAGFSVTKDQASATHASVPVAKPAAKRISLTSLKAGGSSSVAKIPLAPASVPESRAIQPPAPAAEPSSSAKAAISLISAKRPAVALSLGKAAAETPESAPAAPAAEPEAVAPAAPVAEAETAPVEDRAPVEGVDIIEAAKVIGTEGEAKANEILSEALMDPEEAKKAAEERAVQAVVIPESSKEFFTNLKIMDDMFDDDMFDGIVPKDEKPVQAASEAPAVAASQESAVTVATPVEAPVAPEVSPEEKTSEISASAEAASEAEGAVAMEAPVGPAETGVPAEAPAVASAEALSAPPAVSAQYVESVAKDLSIERKGGLAKLFGERKILVRSAAGLLAVAVIAGGAFSLPSFKTSAPEAVPTATDAVVQPVGENGPAVDPTPVPEPLPVVTAQPSPIYKVNPIRKPNIRNRAGASSGSAVVPTPLAAPAGEALPTPEPGNE